MGIRAVMKKYPIIVLCIIITHVSASNHPLMQKIFTQALTRWSFGTPCPRDWTLFNSYCYLVNSSIKNWHQAQAYCHELEGELVKINSLEENEFVLALARKQAPSVEQVWIGLKRDPRINDFIWSDHSIPVYKNWAPNEPNGGEAELCGHMYTRRTDCLPNRASGYWNDLRCDAIRPGWHCGLVCKRLP